MCVPVVYPIIPPFFAFPSWHQINNLLVFIAEFLSLRQTKYHSSKLVPSTKRQLNLVLKCMAC